MTESARTTELLFPSVIQISEVPNAAEFNRRLMPTIEEIHRTVPNGRPDGWSSSIYTTINTGDQLHKMLEFADLATAIMTEATDFAENLKLDIANYPLRITDCFLNIYGPKDGQEVHHHSNNILSGIYYVKASPECSGIIFHSPMAFEMLLPPYTEMNPINSLAREMPVREGMMVLFRSWLKHSVRPNPENAGQRISIVR